MVIVAFKPGEKEISKYEELDQYDYGQILRIQGLNLPQAVEIHFALQKTGGTSKTRIGITKDGVTDVPIPDSMLEMEIPKTITVSMLLSTLQTKPAARRSTGLH